MSKSTNDKNSTNPQLAYDRLLCGVVTDYDERDVNPFEIIPGGCTCCVCGKKYKTDILVPDEIWNKIKPNKGNLMCGRCIVRRISQLKEYAAYKLIEI